MTDTPAPRKTGSIVNGVVLILLAFGVIALAAANSAGNIVTVALVVVLVFFGIKQLRKAL